jgi:CRISPR/Cas system CSM-associated protein Csm2 small subunit
MTPAASVESTLDRFCDLIEASLAQQTFVKLVLAKPRLPQADGPQTDVQRLSVRAITLKGQPSLTFVTSHATRDDTQNFSLVDGLRALRESVASVFSHAHLLTTDEEIQLLTSKKGKRSLSRRKSTHTEAKSSDAHDHQKQRLIHQDRPWLVALGVTDAQHQIVPAMSRKWKQINKFVEVFASALDKANLPSNHKVSVADFGSGKGYLTFAVHDFLTTTLKRSTDVLGVELRADMVNLCNAAATKLKLSGLRFEEGDVSRSVPDKLDVMIALHACDTATDHAIHVGVRTGASVILCSPCCHKQLRPQLMSPHPLQPLLQHGVHLGQQAEMLTDGLRAMLLDACGYETQVFEFVALEHTQKNKMILAVKRAALTEHASDNALVLAQVRELKTFYGIRDQCLETLLRDSGLLGSKNSAQPGNLNPI